MELLLCATPVMCQGPSHTVSHLSLGILAEFRGKEAEVRLIALPWVELYPFKIHTLKSWPLIPQNLTFLGHRVIAEVIS